MTEASNDNPQGIACEFTQELDRNWASEIAERFFNAGGRHDFSYRQLRDTLIDVAGDCFREAASIALYFGNKRDPAIVKTAEDIARCIKGRADEIQSASPLPSAAQPSEREKALYDIRWTRDDGELLECHGLTARTVFSRLRGAIANSGPITVHSIEPAAYTPAKAEKS